MENFKILTPIQFERKGQSYYGVVDEIINNATVYTAVYANENVWGGLVLHDENNARVLESDDDVRKAFESARMYCEREIASMQVYGEDEHALEIIAHVSKMLDAINAIEPKREHEEEEKIRKQ